MRKLFKNKYTGIVIVIIVAAIFRLFAVGAVPYGIANDEVSYIISGYTIVHNGGVDIAGKFLPLSINLDSSLSPVPVYLISLFTGLLSLSPLTARLPFALLGIGIAVLVYFLSLEIFRNRVIALFAGLSLSLSAWQILVTRTVWDVIPAQFFYLLGLYIFLKKLKKGSVLWSLPAFLLGFFSYHGTKVFFAFFILLLLVIYGRVLIKRRKEFVGFALGVVAIFVLFGFVTISQSVTRQQEIIFTNQAVLKEAAKKVEFDRARSSAPEFLKKIESNKLTFFAEKMTTSYLAAFSSNFLITVGDVHPLFGYGVFFKGVLYLIDIPLLFLGIVYIIIRSKFSTSTKTDENTQYRNALFLIGGGLLISPLPSTLASGYSYFIRSFMMSPFFALFIGVGCFVVYKYSSSLKSFRKVFLCGFILIYLMYVLRFCYQYYFQLNTYGSEYWNGSSRQISEYAFVYFS
jgi:4-amino-4-deoxy-L-arabinose transferase-like glycosyltransferase